MHEALLASFDCEHADSSLQYFVTSSKDLEEISSEPDTVLLYPRTSSDVLRLLDMLLCVLLSRKPFVFELTSEMYPLWSSLVLTFILSNTVTDNLIQ